jgi:5-methylcytosine-specific restriction endonuclease McrA
MNGDTPWPRDARGKRKGSTSTWRRTRLQVFRQYGLVCWLCHGVIDMHLPKHHPGAAQVHHLVSAETYDLAFLRPAHRACNVKAGSPSRPHLPDKPADQPLRQDPEGKGSTDWGIESAASRDRDPYRPIAL